LLFRWFAGFGIEDPVWDATSFTRTATRLLEGDAADRFLAAVLSQDKLKRLLSSEHFTVDCTLLEAWAIPKSFGPKDGSGEPPVRDAMVSKISAESGGPMTRISRQTPMPASTVKGSPQARRGGLRLGQDGGRLTQIAASGTAQSRWQFTLAMAAYDLVRLPKLLAQPTV
jgi:hypothetical protein